MHKYLFIDFETRSVVDLRKAGVHVYAKDPSTEVLCVAWAFEEEGVYFCSTPPKGGTLWFLDFVKNGGTVVAHNAAFELEIWNSVCVPKYDWPPLKVEQTICTMAMAYAMGLPGSLDAASAAVGIDAKKDMQGHRIMLQLSQPRAMYGRGPGTPPGVDTIEWYTPQSHPEKFERLYSYCRQDVEVERQLFKRLLQLSPAERDLWILDQRINGRGVGVDLPAVKKAIEIVELEKKRLDQEMREVTKNQVATCNAVAQLTQWLKWRGVDCEKVRKSDVVDLLGGDLPDDCRRALELRQMAAKSSTAKLKAMGEGVGEDGKLRGLLQYHAAHTGRWGGRRIQPQNFPRPKISQGEIEEVMELLS